MNCEFQRLATFKGFRPPPGVFVLSLTGAGFYRSALCEPHQVVYFCCHLSLDVRKLGTGPSFHSMTPHGRGAMELHHQLSSSCSFVQNFFKNQAVSNVYADDFRDSRVPPLCSVQDKRQVRTVRDHYSLMSGMADPEFSVLNGNARRPLVPGHPVTHPDRASEGTLLQTPGLSHKTTSAPVELVNRVPLISPLAQSRHDDTMASGRVFSAVFPARDKSDWNLTASTTHRDSVLGGPGDDLVTDSDLEGIEEESEPPLMTHLSDIGPGTQLKDRRSARQPLQSAQEPGWQAQAAGGVQAHPVGPEGGPGIQAQLSPGEHSVRDSNELDDVGAASNSPSLHDLGIETSLPKFQNYARCSQRLSTYGQWKTVHQRKEELAKAGFFYTGSEDLVQCFCCGVRLNNWDPQDDPWVEHARWRPSCSFVRLSRTADFVSAVQTLLHRTAAGPGSSPIQPGDVEQEMMKSKSQHEIPGDWEDGRGDEEKKKDEEKSDNDIQQRAADLERENSSLRDHQRCKICMDDDVRVLFLPCGHLVTCSECAPTVLTCPMCRGTVKGRVTALTP